MEKIIKIDGKDVKFKATGAFALKYKMQFKRDIFKDLYSMQSSFDAQTGQFNTEGSFDTEMLFGIAWALAKEADRDIPPLVDWLENFEEFPIIDLLPEILNLAMCSITSTAKSKKK